MLASPPHSARAANECGAPVAGAVTCSGSSYPAPNGIGYTNTTGLTLTLDNPALVAQRTMNGQGGVFVNSTVANTNDIVINALRFQSIQSTTPLTNGIGAVNQGTAGNAILRMDTGTVTVNTNALGNGLLASITNSANTGNALITLNGGQVINLGAGPGANAQNAGTGNAAITMTGGSVSANTGAGLRAIITNAASSGSASVNIGGGTVTTSSGTGVLSQSELGNAGIIMTGGTVTVQSGTNSALNAVVNNAAATGTASIAMSGGTVINNGSGDGIFATNTGLGTYNVSVTGGTVTGGAGTGAAIHGDAAAVGTITIGAGATVNAGASGIALNQTGGAAIITTAGTIAGNINLSTATNVLDITGGGIAGNISGGGNSALTFDLGSGSFTYGAAYAISGMNSVAMNSGSAEIDGSLATNTLAVNGGRLVLDGAATVSSGAIVLGGTLVVGDDTHASATLTGPLNVLAGGQLHGIGTIVGDVGSAGVIAPGNSIGTLTIAGNYTGNGGTLQIESVLGGDASPTDKLVVTGNTSGSTFVRVTNLGGGGAQTVEGIKIVDVGGASNGTFTLQGDYVIQGQQAVVGGAYAYTLQKNGVSTPADGDWYLRSSLLNPSAPAPSAVPPGPLYQPGVPLYESYGQILLGMNGLSTFRQRIGGRYSGAGDVAAPTSVEAPSPVWARVEGQHTKMQASNTTGSTYTADQMKLQSGFDGLAFANNLGQLIFGFSAHYTTLTSDIKSFYGNGKINVEGAGIGGSLTWLGENGFYVDGQSQVTWYKSDLSSDLIGTVAANNWGYGYALGAEGGRRVPIGGNFSLTPQAQLVYSSVNFDSFNDRFGALVSNDRARSLLGRAGLSLDHQRVGQGSDGQTTRSDIYGIANLYYEFLNGTVVDVAGTKFASATDRLWGGVGVGGNYRWAGDKYAVYGEVSFNTSLADAGDNYSYKSTVGFRAKW